MYVLLKGGEAARFGKCLLRPPKMPYIETDRASSTPADHAQWEVDRKMRGEGKFQGSRTMQDRPAQDRRVTWFVTWMAGILGSIVTVASIWGVSTLVSLDKSVTRLLDRPVSVSKEQYDSDMSDTKREIATIKIDVKDIQLKQAAAISQGNK